MVTYTSGDHVQSEWDESTNALTSHLIITSVLRDETYTCVVNKEGQIEQDETVELKTFGRKILFFCIMAELRNLN